MPTSRPLDTTWHQQFLQAVTDGALFKEAAEAVGVTAKTVENHFRRFPDLKTAADNLRTVRDRGPAPDETWHPRFLALIAAGESVPTAATTLGVSVRKIEQQIKRNERLRAATAAARAESRRARGRRGIPYRTVKGPQHAGL